MANITPYTNQISAARYGEEVRGSIVNALIAMNNDINSDTQSAGSYASAAAASATTAANTATSMVNTLAQIEADLTAFETAEGLRSTAESARVTAENARAVAELARENSETGYVAQAKAYAEQAAALATSDYAMLAKSWAVGNAGGARDDEATNNSKYWSEQSAATANERGTYWSTQLATAAGTYMANMQAEVAEAEAWATGGTNGTPSATNNAKYWSEQAEELADSKGEYWDAKLETTAQSWVEGGTGTRTGEDTNNAKYWSEQAYYWYQQAGIVVTEGGVTYFNGRTGAVTPDVGDYTAAMISRGTGTVETTLQSLETETTGNASAIETLQGDVGDLQTAVAGKVSMTDMLCELDTTAASSTVDGALYASIVALGWDSDVVES